MRIAVIGTSNSVMGNTGFIQALRLSHDVLQMSSGRTPFLCSLKTIINERERIESCDLLILEHYINDVNYYGEKFGKRYRELICEFYAYLSTLNVNILNLLFPIIDLEERPAFDIYEMVLEQSIKFDISYLDLNSINFTSELYEDDIHLTHDASYAIGLSLIKSFSNIKWENPQGGICYTNPFSLLTAKDIVGNNTFTYKNSLVEIELINLTSILKVERKSTDRLICLGYFVDKKKSGVSGVMINENIKFGFGGPGYFMETIDVILEGDLSISPLHGEDEVTNLMQRGISKGRFDYCYISELMFHDSSIDIEYSSASRQRKLIKIDDFYVIYERLFSEKHPKILPKTIDKIRDIAVHIENNDLEIAKDLMALAHYYRPDGNFIKSKLEVYRNIDRLKSNK